MTRFHFCFEQIKKVIAAARGNMKARSVCQMFYVGVIFRQQLMSKDAACQLSWQEPSEFVGGSTIRTLSLLRVVKEDKNWHRQQDTFIDLMCN